jgi:hypothetical protein
MSDEIYVDCQETKHLDDAAIVAMYIYVLFYLFGRVLYTKLQLCLEALVEISPKNREIEIV